MAKGDGWRTRNASTRWSAGRRVVRDRVGPRAPGFQPRPSRLRNVLTSLLESILSSVAQFLYAARGWQMNNVSAGRILSSRLTERYPLRGRSGSGRLDFPRGARATT